MTRCWRVSACHPALDAGSRGVPLVSIPARVFPGFCVGARNDRSAKPSGLWEKSVRKMRERDVCGERIEGSQNPAFIGQGAGKPGGGNGARIV